MDQVNDATAINLSTGIYTSFVEFARTAAEILGYQPEVKGTSNTPEGVFARAGDTEKQHRLGFHHAIDFRTGVQKALNYYMNHVKYQ
jgi:GDP-L-fucose synthase